MTRKNYLQILLEASINISEEYERLYKLFYSTEIFEEIYDIQYFNPNSIYEICKKYFLELSCRETCTNIQEFDSEYHFNFKSKASISKDDINYFITFCEYLLNFITSLQQIKLTNTEKKKITILETQLNKIIEKISYQIIEQEKKTKILIPKDQVANSVAEIIKDDDLSYRVIEYNHHSMKGDIEQKKSILLRLAHQLEPLDDKLKSINDALKSNLFFMFNNLDLRHNNTTRNPTKEEKQDTYYKEIVAKMPPEELESWYDETYQLCLLAFLELDNVERMQKIEELKKKIKT